MKATYIIATLLVISLISSAQMQTIQLDTRYMQFDYGRKLPAEQYFIINTEIPRSVELVKIQLSDKDFEKKLILYESNWLRKENDEGTIAILPNYFELRSGRSYNFRVIFYRTIQETERQELREMLEVTFLSYLQSNIQQRGRRYRLLNSPSDLFNSMNLLLADGMVNYETNPGGSPHKFSGIIEDILRSMAKIRISNRTEPEHMSNSFEMLVKQVNNEVSMFANNYEYVVYDVVDIFNYPVERTINTLAVNVGYAGIYNSGNFSDLNYYTGPYVGISMPLGNKVFSGNFWGNTYISAGVFMTNFEATNTAKVSGPFIKRPIYGSVGVRMLDFLVFQAGSTLLEEFNLSGDGKSLYLKPFVGLSIEFQIWLGFNK